MTLAGVELLKLSKRLLHIETVSQAYWWTEQLYNWYYLWKDELDRKISINEMTRVHGVWIPSGELELHSGGAICVHRVFINHLWITQRVLADNNIDVLISHCAACKSRSNISDRCGLIIQYRVFIVKHRINFIL